MTAKKAMFIVAACVLTACAAFVFLPVPDAEAAVEATYCAGQDTVTVSNAEEWNGLAERVADGENFSGKTVVLTADISGQISPLGSKETPFCGTLDGGGHVIYSDISGGDYTAPVGFLSLGTVYRLGVHGDMAGEQAVGGVVGFNDHGRVEECYHYGSVSADNYAGGVVGENRGEIISCYSIGDVRARGEGRFAGGIAATNDYDGKIQNCYAVSGVECDIYGGIVGYAGRGSILGCYYDSGKCDRAYSEAGNAVLGITPLTDRELAATAPSGAFSVYGKDTEGWIAYPRLDGVGGEINAYANWSDHLISGDLLILNDGEEVSIVGREGAALPALQKSGYAFSGWFTSEQGGEKVTSTGGSGDLCLYSRFEIITYTITFNLGGGAFADGFSPSLTYTVESGATLPGKDDLVYGGMNFSGWTDENGNEITDIPAGSVGDVTLSAQWSPAAISVITDIGGRYFWVIIDVALAVVLLIEAAAVIRVRKRRAAAYAFAPFSAGMIFYPGGFILACVELALILILPLTLIRRRHAAAVAAEQVQDAEEDEIYPYDIDEEEDLSNRIYGLNSPVRPLALPVFEPLDGVEEIGSRLRFRNSFTARLAMSSGAAKELYRGFKSYALSFKRVKSRISWNGESFHAGRKRAAYLTVTGNCLRVYFALDPSAVPARYKTEFKGATKKYAQTPVMMKVRSGRALRRAMELFDMAAERCGAAHGGQGEIILDNEDVLQGRFSDREELLHGGFIRSDITFTTPGEEENKRDSA